MHVKYFDSTDNITGNKIVKHILIDCTCFRAAHEIYMSLDLVQSKNVL